MSWRLSVVHTTTHRYASEVFSSYNEARIAPLTLPNQVCLDARLTVEPGARMYQYWDYWGTLVHAFDIHRPHTELVVRGTAIVETMRAVPPPAGAPWGIVRSDATRDRFAELLEPTAYVPELPDALEELRRGAAASPQVAAQAAADWVTDRLVYETGATDVTTSAQEALARGRGVCQDFAHLTLALLRGLGIPGRYVSGYLHPTPDAAVGEAVEGQGHAWVEWWAGEWVGWDPTHRMPAGERHVVVARGRDYADVPPLKGIYHGAAPTSHEVSVAITRTG